MSGLTEEALWLDHHGEQMLGILHRATGEPGRTGVVIVVGGGARRARGRIDGRVDAHARSAHRLGVGRVVASAAAGDDKRHAGKARKERNASHRQYNPVCLEVSRTPWLRPRRVAGRSQAAISARSSEFAT